jgi:hypothetical protein
MARQPAKPSLYVVQRVAISTSRWGQIPKLFTNDSDELSVVPLRGLAKKKQAEALRKELERQARQSTSIGPFLFGILPDRLADIEAAVKKVGLLLDLSTLGKRVEPDRSRHGVRGFGRDYSDYLHKVEAVMRAWWADRATDVTPAINAALWDELFPEHRFFTVARVRIED